MVCSSGHFDPMQITFTGDMRDVFTVSEDGVTVGCAAARDTPLSSAVIFDAKGDKCKATVSFSRAFN